MHVLQVGYHWQDALAIYDLYKTLYSRWKRWSQNGWFEKTMRQLANRSKQLHSALSETQGNLDEEVRLRNDILALEAQQSLKRILLVLPVIGWHVNHEHVERCWREQGLRAPKQLQKRKRVHKYMAVAPVYAPSIRTMYGVMTL